MNRRDFTYSIAAAGLSSMLLKNTEIRKSLKASRLNVGDTVGLIAPAGLLTEEKIQNAITKLQEYGFKVKEGKHLREKYGYLAGTDAQRLEDLHNMYTDPEVKGIWCARGGYGCTRILTDVDFRLIKKNPKVLIGYSDITALLNSIYQETGLIGFHGPLGSSPDNEYSRAILRDLVMFPKASVDVIPYNAKDHNYQTLITLVGGKARGVAVGGNLSLIAAMAGTAHEINCKGKMVFIEDVGEEPYRIDRMLTQLMASSDMNKAAGIVFGQFKGCNPDHPERSLSLLQVLEDKVGSLGIPSVFGVNFGHVDHNFTFPIGAMTEVDFDSGNIRFLEPAVL